MAEALRTLKIKAGIVKRLRNDLEYSRKECENERQRLRKLVDGGADEYEIRAQEKVISDTDQMVPDYQHRLVTAIDDLETLVSLVESSLLSSQELNDAHLILRNARVQSI